MRKLLVGMLSVAMMLLCFTSCVEDQYSKGYNDGYNVGRETGYIDGAEFAQHNISELVESDFGDIDYYGQKEGYLSTEDSINIITNYADGEPITEEELHHAIWSIHHSYNEIHSIIYNIDEYDVFY